MSGRLFQSLGAQIENALSPYVLPLLVGTLRKHPEADLKVRVGTYFSSKLAMYNGASPLSALNVSKRTLKIIC